MFVKKFSKFHVNFKNVQTKMHASLYGFESLFLRRKEEKVSSVFVLETLKAFLFNILTLDYDRREGSLRL